MHPPDKDRVPEAIHKALAHPLRRRILRVLRQAGNPLAPIDVAEQIGEPDAVSNIAYHFAVLEKYALVDPHHMEPVRGSIKHYYVAGKAFTPDLGDTLALDQIAELLEEAAAEISEGVLNEIIDIIVASGRPIR
jgi:DNA-binding transcriptional ArsR family regulator